MYLEIILDLQNCEGRRELPYAYHSTSSNIEILYNHKTIIEGKQHWFNTINEIQTLFGFYQFFHKYPILSQDPI